LAVLLTAANVNEGTVLERLLDAIPPIRQPSGRRRRRPDKLHADKGYDSRAIRTLLRQRHIVPRIARRGIESSQKLGRHRWVVERTFAWLHRHRRLLVRYDRRTDIHEAFLALGCALICWHLLPHASRYC
jgi:transposase